MLDTQVWVALSAAVVILTSVLKSVDWSAQVKHLVATVVSVSAAAFGAWQAGAIEVGSDLLESALTIYGSSQLLYAFLMKGTPVGRAVNDRLENLGVK